jgi:membrane protein implicated in regulation of membrane protease activity
LIWLLAAGVLAIAEALSLDLVLIMLAIAALATAGAAALGAGAAVQVAVFAVVSLGLVVVVRPLAQRRMRVPLTSGTAHRDRGAQGPQRGGGADRGPARGRVRLAGEEWSAQSVRPLQVLPVGKTVQVMEIRGATAVVWSHE